MSESLWGWKKDDMFWHQAIPGQKGRPAIVTGRAKRAIYFSYLDERPTKKYSLNNPTKMKPMSIEEYLGM